MSATVFGSGGGCTTAAVASCTAAAVDALRRAAGRIDDATRCSARCSSIFYRMPIIIARVSDIAWRAPPTVAMMAAGGTGTSVCVWYPQLLPLQKTIVRKPPGGGPACAEGRCGSFLAGQGAGVGRSARRLPGRRGIRRCSGAVPVERADCPSLGVPAVSERAASSRAAARGPVSLPTRAASLMATRRQRAKQR